MTPFLDLIYSVRSKHQYILANRKKGFLQKCSKDLGSINNGNRTLCRPIWSVIIRVINEIGRSPSGSPICFITNMITDRRKVRLPPINHNNFNFRGNKCIPLFVKELLIPNTGRVTVESYKSMNFGKSAVW